MSVDLSGVPPELRSAIIGMQNAVRQKWHEAATTYFARAVINSHVARQCENAGLADAQCYFTQKAIWMLAEGVWCYGKMLDV